VRRDPFSSPCLLFCNRRPRSSTGPPPPLPSGYFSTLSFSLPGIDIPGLDFLLRSAGSSGGASFFLVQPPADNPPPSTRAFPTAHPMRPPSLVSALLTFSCRQLPERAAARGVWERVLLLRTSHPSRSDTSAFFFFWLVGRPGDSVFFSWGVLPRIVEGSSRFPRFPGAIFKKIFC